MKRKETELVLRENRVERLEIIVKGLTDLAIENGSELYYVLEDLLQIMTIDEIVYFSSLTKEKIEQILEEE